MRNFFSLRAYLKFLERNKLFAFINVAGFAVSMAFVVLLGIYLTHEFSIDRFHTKCDRIFRLETDTWSATSPGLAPILKERYPEIEQFVRVIDWERIAIDKEGGKINASVLLADSSFFDVFSFDLVEGNPRDVMRTPSDVVINESFARKVFGDEAAMGRDIVLGDRHYTVSGVAADFELTHFRNPDIIIRIEDLRYDYGDDVMSETGFSDFGLYLLIRENADLGSKLADIRDFMVENKYEGFDLGLARDVVLTPLDEIYFTQHRRDYMVIGNSPVFMSVLVVTIIFILLFAVINYINLSSALSAFRAKEAATRRLLGGTRRQLFAGFIA